MDHVRDDLERERSVGKERDSKWLVFTSTCGGKRDLNKTYTCGSPVGETPWYMIQRYKNANKYVSN